MGRLDDAAKAVLAEYRAIRREYNGLDGANPDHAPRRKELKARYYELNRRYGRLTTAAKETVRNAAALSQSGRVRRPKATRRVETPRSRRNPAIAQTAKSPSAGAPGRRLENPAYPPGPHSIRPKTAVGGRPSESTAVRSAPESPMTVKALTLGGWSLVGVGAALAVSFVTGLGREAVVRVFEAVDFSVVAELQYGLIASGAVIVLGGMLIGIGSLARHFIRLFVPIHEFARKGQAEALARAIAIGVDIDARDRRGCTPLHFAVVAGRKNAASVLLENGADPEAVNDRGETPLFMAAANRDLELVIFLIALGANARATNKNGSTLMHIAASAGDLDLVKVAEKHRLDCQQQTKQGYTPLHFAAQSGNVRVLERLLAAGANPDASCKSGATPLCSAARDGHMALVRILVRAGAEVNVKRGYDYPGPLAVALEGRHGAVADLLRKHGASPKRAQPAA